MIKTQGTNHSGDWGRRACYMAPDLSYDYGGEIIRRAKVVNGICKKKGPYFSASRSAE